MTSGLSESIQPPGWPAGGLSGRALIGGGEGRRNEWSKLEGRGRGYQDADMLTKQQL